MLIRGLEELQSLAQEFIEGLSPRAGKTSRTSAAVVALYGDLGAGKTAFVKAAAKALGVAEVVTSPTFVLEKIYPLEGRAFKRLIHIDAYRLENPEELAALRFEEIAADPANLVFIEWAERAQKLLPPGAASVRFTFVDKGTRDLAFSYGEIVKR